MDNGFLKLELLWKNFVSTTEKSVERKRWFDLFLAYFLLEYRDKIVPENTFSDVPDAIAQEFITEVQEAFTELDQGDELAPLRKYLLQERGWRCLAAFSLFRNPKIWTLYKLSNLLISLYGVIEYNECVNCQRDNIYIRQAERKSIDELVQEKINAVKKKNESYRERFNKKRENKSRKHLRKERTDDETVKRCQSIDSDSTNNDSRRSPCPKLFLNEAQRIRSSSGLSQHGVVVGMINPLTKSFTDDGTSSSDSVFHTKSSDDNVRGVEMYENDDVRRVFNERVNHYEYSLLVLDLLQLLCRDDNVIPDEYDVLIHDAIKFCVDNLCTLQYRYPKRTSNTVRIDEIRAQLAHLLIVCTNGAKHCRRLAESLCENGIVRTYLHLLQETSNSSCQHDKNGDVEFLFALSYAILNLFSRLLRQENATKSIQSFNKLYREFIGYGQGRLVENLVKNLSKTCDDREVRVARLKIIVTVLGSLIVRFKKLKRKMTRLEECRLGWKTNTESESTTELPNHHDNLFGKPYQPLMKWPNALQENCCVTSTFVRLLKIALERVDDELTVCTLKVLIFCGCCCCVPTYWFLPKTLELLKYENVRIRQLTLAFLEKRFYADVGMFRNNDCVVCQLPPNNDDRRRHLNEYGTLLSCDVSDVVRIVGGHLFKVFSRFNYNVQKYLLTRVFGTVFADACRRYVDEHGRCKDVISICLAIIAEPSVNRELPIESEGLLQTREVRELLQTRKVRELLYDSNFTELCCRILETRISCKLSKLENGASTFTPVLVESCTGELNALLVSFNQYYDDLVEQIRDDVDDDEKLTGSVDGTTATATATATLNVAALKTTLEGLKSLTGSLERLIVRNGVIKSYFEACTTKEKFEKLLFIALRLLAAGGERIEEKTVGDISLKLTRPLLVICLSVMDKTDEIETKVKELLNDALYAGKISLKQVCDSLLSADRQTNDNNSTRKRENEWKWSGCFSLFDDADNGYEADDDDEDETLSWSNVVDSVLSETSDEEGGDRLVSLLENCSKSKLLYPTVCTVAVDLINALRVDQCTEETLYCLHHIAAICKYNEDICEELIKRNVTTKLLDKLEDSLKEELLTPEETDVQHAITQFLSILFYHKSEKEDVTRFFDLFKLKRAPYDHLMNALIGIVNRMGEKTQPSFYVTFPCDLSERTMDSDDPIEALLLSMREIQRRGAAVSPWVVCAVGLPLNTNLEWCLWLTGFATSFWIQTEIGGAISKADETDILPDSINDEMIHVMSIGYDTFLFETWLDETRARLVFRLARPEGDNFEILSQVSFRQRALDDGRWHHVGINVKDRMRQQKIALEVTVTIDGTYTETKYLTFIGIFVRKVRPACIMIGDTRPPSASNAKYNFGNLIMFRNAVLTPASCLTLRAYGPDVENVLICASKAARPMTANLRWSSPSEATITPVRLTNELNDNVKRMRDNVLITYAPRDPAHYYQYVTNDAGNALAVSMFPPATPAFFKKSKSTHQGGGGETILVPKMVNAIVLFAYEIRKRNTFYARILDLGGYSFLAFMFARLIDICRSESIQCDGLRVLIRACLGDARLYAQFAADDGYAMVARVISSSRFVPSRLAFMELADAVCDRRAFFVDGDDDDDGEHERDETYRCKHNAYVRNANILTALLLSQWKIWEKCGGGDDDGGGGGGVNLMTVLFRGLRSLVSGSNAYRALNYEQLTSVNILERTLDMCKEKFALEEKCENVDGDLCTAMLEFIQTMIGTPPSIEHIRSIVGYLYAVHPSSLSFCADSSNGYYFLFSTLTQHKAKKNTDDEDGGSGGDKKSSPLYGRVSLNRSVIELQEKRKFINKYLRNTATGASSSVDEDDLKETKTVTDSGIAGSSNADENTSTDPYADVGGEYEESSVCSSTTAKKSSNVFYTYLGETYENRLFGDQSDGSFKGDCNQYLITNGLLNLIHDSILVLPDSSVNVILKKILDYKLFLILANHPNAAVRYTVVKTTLAWLIRCDEEETVRFVVREKGFYHLANQLAMYPATEELVNGCISLMARCHWDPFDQINEIEEANLPSLHFSALPPLLAVFPGTVHNYTLATNVIRFLKVLVNKVPQGLKKLVENGAVESLVKTVLVLIHSDANNDEIIHENSVLLNDIIDLFALLMTNCVQTPGALYVQMLNEIVYKCRYLEVTEEALCGMEMECVQIIHNLHCSVLQAGLDTVLSLIESYHSQDFVKGRRSPLFLSSMTGAKSASLSSIPSSIMSFASFSNKQKQLTRNELIDRYKLIINRATEYLEFSSSSVVTDKDVKFACHLFSTLINGVANIMHNKSYIRIGSPWSSVFWSSRDTLRTQASNLLIWMLAPVRPTYLRMFAIEALLMEPKARDIIKTLVFSNVEVEQKFTIFLWHLMYSKTHTISEADSELCEEFKDYLQDWELISPELIGEAHERWQFEVSAAVRELSVTYWTLEKSQQDAVYKCVYKMENLSKKISDVAVSISAAVAERQGKERKKLLYDLRNKYKVHVEARNKWRRIVQQMCHEKAPWYDPEMYPNCWELDPTEGPGRIRKRMRRCYLNIEAKFFKKDAANKIRKDPQYPISYLFENNDGRSLSTVTLDTLSTDDTIAYMCYATNIQPGYEVDGELLIGAKYLYFVAGRIADRKVTPVEEDKFSFIVEFRNVNEIHNRRFNLKECAIEFFLSYGKTYFLAFGSQMDRDSFLTALSECPLANRNTNDTLLSSAVEKWREGLISNWEYLKTLNKMAGRSHNDLMQYPVMPFILADYKSEEINIKDENIYRNLKKPMAVQDKKKELYFINHYNYLKSDTSNVQQQPYHYASHYSNSGTVLHFLLRLPPFTQVFLQYQDNNFDLPDRSFHSLDTTWRLTSSESTTDVKELIPEFFYLPEFLLNLENFNIGVRQNGEIVDNVKLPTWANGDARLFVLIHRQILESEFVRENLPHWIDLIFGCKQTGKAAVDAINVFHPATYYGFDVDSIPDSLERTAWETMIRTYGQTPRQLFRSPHPMVVQNLTVEKSGRIPVNKAVKGLRWGNYIGSPSKEMPTIVWSNYYSSSVESLVPLVTNDVFGLPASTSLLLSYNKERSVNLVNEGVTLMGAALLSWGYPDGIIRIKERKEQPQSPALFCPPDDPVTVCSTTPDCPFIWVGLTSGNILVFRYTFYNESGGVYVENEPIILIGHKKKVNAIYLSQSFGIAVSVSEDESAIVWDLNESTYVRSIFGANYPLKIVGVSETLGDIATVGHEEYNGSVLRLHTINATLVGTVSLKERITSLCFSTALEGISVNVIATGLHDGVIRLWSTWDLSPVTDITSNVITSSIVCLAYSYDCQHLYASVSDGNVFIWEAANSSGTVKTPKFLNLTSIN